MYTFTPIATIDTVNNHAGVILMAMLVFVLIIIITLSSNRYNRLDHFLMSFFVGTVAVGIAALVSYNTGTITTYKNEPVTATFVTFQPEGYNEARQNGKTTRRVDVHNMYVVYKADGQNVILPAVAGGTYPDTITLYKN